MSEIDPVHFKALLASSPPAKRQALMQLLGQLKQLVETRERSLALKQELEKKQARLLEEAEIRISGTAFAGVQVCMGNGAFKLDKDLQGPIFTRTPSGIRWRAEK